MKLSLNHHWNNSIFPCLHTSFTTPRFNALAWSNNHHILLCTTEFSLSPPHHTHTQIGRIPKPTSFTHRIPSSISGFTWMVWRFNGWIFSGKWIINKLLHPNIHCTYTNYGDDTLHATYVVLCLIEVYEQCRAWHAPSVCTLEIGVIILVVVLNCVYQTHNTFPECKLFPSYKTENIGVHNGDGGIARTHLASRQTEIVNHCRTISTDRIRSHIR